MHFSHSSVEGIILLTTRKTAWEKVTVAPEHVGQISPGSYSQTKAWNWPQGSILLPVDRQFPDIFPEAAEIWLQEKSAYLYDIRLTLYKEEYIKCLNLLNTFSDYNNAIL